MVRRDDSYRKLEMSWVKVMRKRDTVRLWKGSSLKEETNSRKVDVI